MSVRLKNLGVAPEENIVYKINLNVSCDRKLSEKFFHHCAIFSLGVPGCELIRVLKDIDYTNLYYPGKYFYAQSVNITN